MTPATVAAANKTPYTPRNLPKAFSLGSKETVNIPSSQIERSEWPSDAQVEPYRIGVGDVLVFKLNDPNSPAAGDTGASSTGNGRVIVDDDGSVHFAGVGAVLVLDMTISQARQSIIEALKSMEIDPRFELSIAEFNSRKVAVIGDVANPGVLKLEIAPLRLGEALALAGGGAKPDESSVEVRLYRGDQFYAASVFEFRRSSAIQNVQLLHGDRVVVLANDAFANEAQRDQANRSRQSDADVRARFIDRQNQSAQEQDFVYIAGEVETQRRFSLPYETRATLADALYNGTNGVARGTGDPSEIYVIRKNGSDDVVVYKLPAGNAVNLLLAADFELRPKDFIFVTERKVAAFERFITGVLSNPVLTVAGN